MRADKKLFIGMGVVLLLCLAYASEIRAHEDPLGKIPWPKGEKVPCRCDILAMPYELCLKGIGAKECFKVKEVKQPVKPEKKKCSKLETPGAGLHWQDTLTFSCEENIFNKVSEEEENVIPIPETEPEAPQMPPYNGQPLIYNEALPCHPVDIWLEKMQNEFQLYPFAQGKATVRSAHNFEFTYPEMIMLANPLLKRFMMLGVWENGYACVLASGTEFESFNK